MSARAEARRFTCAVPDEAIADLHRRIDATRWPDELDGAAWDYGTPLGFLREVADHWRHRFDCRAAEARINAFDQYKLAIDGLDIHFIHRRPPHPGATPLLMTHGWPESTVDLLDVIPRLAQPELFSGQIEEAVRCLREACRVRGRSARLSHALAGRRMTLGIVTVERRATF